MSKKFLKYGVRRVRRLFIIADFCSRFGMASKVIEDVIDQPTDNIKKR